MNLTKENIKQAKLKLEYPSDLFINGRYQKSISENYFDNISPIDGKVLNKISFAQKEDIELAVSMDSCLAKKSKNFGSRDGMITSSEARDEYAYKIIKEISSNDCQNLAPNIKGTCIKSYELTIYDWGGGSSGHWLTNQIYGLFRLSNNSEYIFPLGEES